MRDRSARNAGIAAAGGVAAALTLAACGGTGAPKLQEKTLRITEGAEQASTFVDNPPRTKRVQGAPEQASLGDEFAFDYAIVSAGKKKIGDLAVTCTVTKAARIDAASTECAATATLPGGTIAVSTAGRAGPRITGAVVGGTGKYEGAAGTFTTRRSGQARAQDVFHLYLPKR